MKHLALASLALASLMMAANLTATPAGAKAAKRRPAARSAPAPAPTPTPTRSTAAQATPAPATAAETADSAAPADERRESEPAPPPARARVLAATEAPAPEAKEAPPTPPAPSADLEKLRADYDRLRDELFRARARAQIVEEGLWKSKLSATFRWKGGPGYLVHHATVKLDGGELWDSGDKPVTDDLVTVAERAVKPGPHALTLRIEIRPGKKSKDSDRLGYVSEHTFAIIVPDDKRTRVAITGDEDGDAPEYEPEIEVELESLK
jgi:hypothetical protein